MIIYQGQPNRAFPNIFCLHKKDKDPVCYEFSTQFEFQNDEDAKYMENNRFIHYNKKSIIPRFINDEYFNPISIRFKSYHNQPEIDKNDEIDYAYGLFESSRMSKKIEEKSFTIIDHPINQILNIYYYIKNNIISKEEIEASKHLLEIFDDELKDEIKNYKVDLDTFFIPNLYEESLDFRVTKDFFIKYKQEREGLSLEQASEIFQDYYARYYIYMLLCSTSLDKLSCMEEWVDYYLSNPTLKGLLKYKNIDFTYNKMFTSCSELSLEHDFYGIMTSRKTLLKSLNIASNINDKIFFELSPGFTHFSPMENFSYKRKELESALEKDINFFEQKKQIFYEHGW